jgi:hypothetical protein
MAWVYRGLRMKFVLAIFTAGLLMISPALAEPPLELDHLLFYAKTGAPERNVLQKSGFIIAPMVSHHTGQGTSSVTVEFANGYLELLYPDPDVAVSDRMKPVAKLFRTRSNWRETGVAPFALQFHRTPATPEAFPFPTTKVRADWMPATESMELLTPRDMTKALGLIVTAEPIDKAVYAKLSVDPVKGAMFQHPNGARRITGVDVIAPSAGELPPAAAYISDAGAATFSVGAAWLMTVTLDDGRQGKKVDLRPTLPAVIRY